MNVRALRIGLVGPLPPPSGGMANQTLQLAGLLREEGAAVEIIQVNRPYWPYWAANLRGVRAAFRLLPYLAHLWQAANRIDLYHVMANSGWSWHLFAAPAIWIALLKGVPVVVNYRGGEADAFLAKALFWVRPSLRRANALLVPSGYLEAVFTKYGFLAEVVPNIINLDRFSPDDSTPSLNNGNAPCILVARNLEPIYDNATAIRAVAIVRQAYPAAKLVIAGSGPERESLAKLVEDLGMKDAVIFTGRVDNDGMAALYRRADVMVNPSLVDNMPNSVLEALASGVPVVSTNVGGVPYLVEHDKTALLVPPKEPQLMASAILALLNAPDKAERIRRAGMQLVWQYAWPQVRARLLQAYANVLAGRNHLAIGKK